MFNMKNCKNPRYNMKVAFEEKHDWTFHLYKCSSRVENYRRITVLTEVDTFSLFGLTVIEARKIAKSINVLPHYICEVLKYNELPF